LVNTKEHGGGKEECDLGSKASHQKESVVVC
jgi:hypothetical protein